VANRSVYLQTMISLASAAFGVVAALAWNSAITALVKQIFGTGGQIVSLFVYAIVITMVAVIVMVNLGKLAERTAEPEA
jgi:amino acid permease